MMKLVGVCLLLAAVATATTQTYTNSDHAEDRMDKAVSAELTSSDLELGNEYNHPKVVALRFESLSIPKSASISSAVLQFEADEVQSGDVSVLITTEASTDPSPFSSSIRNVAARVPGDLSVEWSPAAWSVVGEKGSKQRTPDLAVAVQEAVCRQGWAAGKNMVFLISHEGGAARRAAETSVTLSVSFNDDATGCASLPTGPVTRTFWSMSKSEQRLDTGVVELTSSDLELGNEYNHPKVVGLRFAGVNLSPKAEISSAYLQFEADEVKTGSVTVSISAQDSGNPADFTSASNDVSNRPSGSQAVLWSPPDWSAVGEAGAGQRTPDLRYVVQDLVCRGDWNALQAVVLKVAHAAGTGMRTAETSVSLIVSATENGLGCANTLSPTNAPTASPTKAPTNSPTPAPTAPTPAPTQPAKRYDVLQKPSGVHLDIEPHATAEWKAGDIQGVANQWLDLLEKVQQVLAGSGLPLTVDIPCWYDKHIISRKNQLRPLNEWVMDIVDVVAMMAYRDTAEAILGWVSEEFSYATTSSTNRAKITLIVETSCSVAEDFVTFCQEGAVDMDTQLGLVHNALKDNPAFNGLAIHDYVSYATLPGAGAPSAQAFDRSLFVWKSTLVYAGDAQNTFFDFVDTHRINTLYFGCIALINNEPSSIRRWLNVTKPHGLNVELLYGKHTSALTENHNLALTWTQNAVDMNAGLDVVSPEDADTLLFDDEDTTLGALMFDDIVA